MYRANVAGMRSVEAINIIGCTYRQLDYVARIAALPGMTSGSGSRREWTPEQVTRLAIAQHMAEACLGADAQGRGLFSTLAVAALDEMLPEPPRTGYAVAYGDPLTVGWVSTWADVRRAVEDVGASVVVAYDLDELVGCIALAESVPA